MKNPLTLLREKSQNLDNLDLRIRQQINLKRNIKEKIFFKKSNIKELLKSIEMLNPLSILDRGYAIVLNEKGEAIKSYEQVDKGQTLTARLSKGTIDVEVKNNN